MCGCCREPEPDTFKVLIDDGDCKFNAIFAEVMYFHPTIRARLRSIHFLNGYANMTEQHQKIDTDIASDRNVIVNMENKGEFWKPCPGTTQGYLCCGYQIITPATGCGMYCKYCILQAYFSHQCQIVFTNFDDLEREINTRMPSCKGVIRFGTGEFGDSLFSEHLHGLSQKIATLLEPYPNAIIEFKTKSTNIEPLRSIRNPGKVIIGFSMNTPAMVHRMEKGTASIEERLVAARRCVDQGFSVAFHFDPMFVYDTWEADYRAVVQAIHKMIPHPDRIAWVSIGGFRSMSSLKTLLKTKNDHLSLFSGEMILAADGKYRYFRPLRVALYKAMQDEFERLYGDITLYMCMESPEVWRESGMIKRIPKGLVSYLDQRAERILGL